jgi:hypothetical protein
LSARKVVGKPKSKPISQEAKEIGQRVDRLPKSEQRELARIAAGKRPLRSLQDIQKELAELHPKARQAQAPYMELIDRVNALTKERDEHPDTVAANLANLRLGTENTGAYMPPGTPPELGAVLLDIASKLDDVEACVHVVYYALGTGADINTTAKALWGGAVNNITTQIDRLRDAVEGARLRGSRMVVVKPSEDAEAQS